MADKEEDAGNELLRESSVQNGQQVALAEPDALNKTAKLNETKADDEDRTIPPISWKRRVFNLKFFVFIATLVGTVVSIETTQRIASLTTLERRFGFTSVQLGIIMASYDVGHVFLLAILSVIGHKIHQPRMCGYGGVFTLIGCFLWDLPHIIFGPGTSMAQDPESSIITSYTNGSDAYADIGRCVESYSANRTLGDYCDLQEMSVNNTMIARNPVETWTSFAFFFAGQTLLGAGLAPYLTVDFTYIDDNTDPHTSAVYVGIILSVATAGGVLGFLLGAFVLGYPADLQPTKFTQTDPEWIGAWWLSAVVTAILILIVTPPLFFFPRSLRDQPAPSRRVNRLEEDSREQTQAEKFRSVTQRKPSFVSTEDLHNISTKSKPLFTNVVFIACTVAMFTVIYLIGGFFIFLPKYYEVQFMQTFTMANVITSFVTMGPMATGAFAGGYIASYFQMERKGISKLLLFVTTLFIALFIVATLFGCSQQQLAGNVDPYLTLNASMPCNFNCTCGMEFKPVCGEDQITYYSACHAGCKDITSLVGETVSYANCTCVAGGNGTAVIGRCILGCKMVIPYSIITFVSVFTLCIATSPFIALLIRSVEPKQKALALGINNIATSVFGTVPAPMLYGALIDNSCIMKMPSCQGGGCILYNNTRFRFYMHGLTILVVSITDISLLVALISILLEEKRERKKAEAKAIDAAEAVPMVQNT